VDEKKLWVFAGPNGSGKSTIINRYLVERLPMINPDIIAHEIDPLRINEPDVHLKAGKIALQRRKEYLQEGISFALETTLSGTSEIKFINDTSTAGYQVNIVYVAVKNSMQNVSRVELRVERGGHNVPPEDIVRRYDRSMSNIALLLKMVDRCYIIDNSDLPHLCAVVINGRVRTRRKILPDWVSKIIGGSYEKLIRLK
jgi:predicted ABC-type ATPase